MFILFPSYVPPCTIFLIRSLRDRLQRMLEANELRYRISGERITILDESSGSGFVCSSDVKLGDAIGRLRKLEQGNIGKRQDTVLRAAKIIQEDMKLLKTSVLMISQ